MAKTLILTNEQLNEIIDGTPYLDLTDNGLPDNIHSNETTEGGGGVKGVKPHTSDEVGKWMGQSTNNWSTTRGGSARLGGIPIVGMGQLEEVYTKKDFEEKMLKEMNSQLKGMNMTATIPNPNDPENPIVISGQENELAKQKTIAKQNGDKQTYDALNRTLSAQRERIKSGKKTRAAAGMPNQFQKPGGTRNNGGKAHTPKNDNLIHTFNPLNNN